MAQRRRQERMMKAQQRKSTILCIAIGLSMTLLSLCISMLVFDTRSDELPPDAPAATSLPYDESMPFSLSDLTNEQLLSIRKDGRLAVSDGPRGISIGDTLDELLARYPSTIARTDAAAQQDVSMTDEEMQTYTDEYLNNQDSIVQTGIQSDEEMILYCAEYFENQNGMMVALPPRGLLTVQGGNIVVTLLSPTTAYPAGTKDHYGHYEHVYCVYTIEPDTMTVSNIVLGIDQ